MQQLFNGIFETGASDVISPSAFLLCIAVSLIAGFLLSRMAMWRINGTKSFMVTLAVLPAAVCAVIMMVNGNIGTGVAVAGAFALVRFRSTAGTAREICAIFSAMVIGLMTGMGYLAYGILFTLVIGAVLMLYTAVDYGSDKESKPVREVRITIPEDLEYEGVFDPVFRTYTEQYRLMQVKTTHMGSLFRLSYEYVMKNNSEEKAFIDALRVRNGNLEIMISDKEMKADRDL